MISLFGRPVTHYLAPFCLLCLTIVYLALALDYGPEARMLPLLVGSVLLVMLPLDLISISDTPAGRKLRETLNPAAGEEAEALGGAWPQLRALGWMLIFAAMLPLIGIALAIPVYIAGSLRTLGRKSWTQSLLTAAIVGASSYGLFQLALGIDLYPGLLIQPAGR